MITLEQVSKTFTARSGQVRALDDVSLHVEPGEIYGVIGRSGAGKSTLIRAVNMLERPDSGTVTVDGVELTGLDGAQLRRARQRIGMIFQQFNLLESRTVRGNVELALEIAGVDRAARRTRSAEILELVGLTDRAGARVFELSGGQKQRVGIARALAGNPKVLLSDEATSALDPETTASILGLLRRLNEDLGLTILLITHEMDVVKSLCDSAALMRDGRIVESGRLDDIVVRGESLMSPDLFPLGELPDARGTTIIEITFVGLASEEPVISRLARTHELDVSLLGAAIETIHGRQTGRTRLELTGSAAQVDAAVADLRGQGLTVARVREAR
ncbi:ATP-binding cassette domain-containing protein [Demequina capsici]|uniref:ATP-binding cassette domain-containing protein n=1 Tax=Demequina capsici TaxID=3075620 RepID=A0AA96F7U6_9MICO|nr:MULTISPECIES: ATP-binding cassette domain-containing protein [unclassified Demequina]WNM25209.1 ATP-binding cassette domain-containing protein [Demequina sp. OYTSA14]WNM28122.1 ATP-binding cassette domain-containing protein [Demequina sp. PMTSA13]